MSQAQPSSNPFALMMDPESVFQAIERSERLARLKSRICRPLDKPVAPAEGERPAAEAADDAEPIEAAEAGEVLAGFERLEAEAGFDAVEALDADEAEDELEAIEAFEGDADDEDDEITDGFRPPETSMEPLSAV